MGRGLGTCGKPDESLGPLLRGSRENWTHHAKRPLEKPAVVQSKARVHKARVKTVGGGAGALEPSCKLAREEYVRVL